MARCAYNEVAVGSCSGGGWFGGKDCPGGNVHQLKCCAIPDFLNAFWDEYYSDHGVPLDCRDHPTRPILVGQCHSGGNHDCGNAGNLVDCAEGRLGGRLVGPTSQCRWDYIRPHGQPMECSYPDEIIVGRCGSGRNEGQTWRLHSTHLSSPV